MGKLYRVFGEHLYIEYDVIPVPIVKRVYKFESIFLLFCFEFCVVNWWK